MTTHAPQAHEQQATPPDRTSRPAPERPGLRIIRGGASGPYSREEVRLHGRTAIQQMRADRERRRQSRAEAKAA